MGKMKKNLGKLPYLAQKLLLGVSSHILFFVLISNPNVRLYKLSRKCMTALLTVTETRLKYPM